MGYGKNNKEKQKKMSSYAEILEAIAHAPIEKRAMTNLGVLNEAYAYAKPSSFARGMRIDIGDVCILLISGTAPAADLPAADPPAADAKGQGGDE